MRTCCVCEKENAPYKCPTCRKPYCSVACCKHHKTQVCEPPSVSEVGEEPENPVRYKYEFPTEDTVPLEKLQQLQHSDELKQCLKNPHVRDIIKTIVSSADPTSTIALAMKEPIFVETAYACLKVVEPPDDQRAY